MTQKILLLDGEAGHGEGSTSDPPRAACARSDEPPRNADRALPTDHVGAWINLAPATREFLRRLREAAEQDTPVYLWGEPGAGCTLAAHTLCAWRAHWRSMGGPRGRGSKRPVPVLRVPSLRERLQDLPGIAGRHLTVLAREAGHSVWRLTPPALSDLSAREWRGNVAELHSVLDAASRRAGGRAVIEVADLPPAARPRSHPSQEAKQAAQRDCLLRQLRAARSVSGAARLEGCTRSNYIRLMRRLGIVRADCAGDGTVPPGNEPADG